MVIKSFLTDFNELFIKTKYKFWNFAYYLFKDDTFQMSSLLDFAESGPFNDFVHHFLWGFQVSEQRFRCERCLTVPVNFSLQVAPKEKSDAVGSHDRGSQANCVPFEIKRSSSSCCRRSNVALGVWVVASSCWIYMPGRFWDNRSCPATVRPKLSMHFHLQIRRKTIK